MAQRSHVPKFGNWDGDNVPYTVYFENARKDRVGGNVRMNPNDPEENPDFFSGFMNASDSSSNSAAPLQKGLDKQQIEGQKEHYGHYQRDTFSDQQKSSMSQKSTTSESSSNKNNPDNANHPRNLHQRKRSENKKSISENSHSFFPLSPSPGRNRLRGGTNASDDISFKSTSVPKFGAWDEKDPSTAEGFTVIFNKVKEEKQVAGSKFQPVQSQTSNRPENHKRESGSKMRCCLF